MAKPVAFRIWLAAAAMAVGSACLGASMIDGGADAGEAAAAVAAPTPTPAPIATAAADMPAMAAPVDAPVETDADLQVINATLSDLEQFVRDGRKALPKKLPDGPPSPRPQ